MDCPKGPIPGTREQEFIKKIMKRDAAGRTYSTNPSVLKRPRLTATQTAAVKQEVTRQLARKADYKQCNGRDLAAVGVPATGYMLDLYANMVRGDLAANNFEGSIMYPKSIKMRAQWEATDGTNMIRIIIGQWFGVGIPAATDILSLPSVTSAQAPLCFRNWSRKHQYKILHDELIQLQNTATFVGGLGPTTCKEIFVPGKSLRPTEWTATTDDTQKGHLFMLTVSDSAALDHPTQEAVWEIIFTD